MGLSLEVELTALSSSSKTISPTSKYTSSSPSQLSPLSDRLAVVQRKDKLYTHANDLLVLEQMVQRVVHWRDNAARIYVQRRFTCQPNMNPVLFLSNLLLLYALQTPTEDPAVAHWTYGVPDKTEYVRTYFL